MSRFNCMVKIPVPDGMLYGSREIREYVNSVIGTSNWIFATRIIDKDRNKIWLRVTFE